MKNQFERFFEIINKSIEYDPWVKDTGMEGYCNELKKEIDEVLEAIKKKDMKNLEEELGDVLYVWAHACKLAEQKGIFKTEEVINGAMEKLNRRKPYLEQGKKVTREEALTIWKEVKQKEKMAKAVVNK